MRKVRLGIMVAVVTLGLVGFGTAATAQGGPDAGADADAGVDAGDAGADAGEMGDVDEQAILDRMIDNRVEQLDQQLELSDRQARRVRRAYEAYFDELQAAQQEFENSVDEARIARDQEMEDILTDRQLADLREMRRQRQVEMIDQRLERMKATLDLTDEQVRQIDRIYQQARQDLEEIYGNVELDAQQRREELENVLDETDQKVDEVLNERQRRRLQRMRQGYGDSGPEMMDEGDAGEDAGEDAGQDAGEDAQ